jgi:SNF2 family DNA or RNA helicase
VAHLDAGTGKSFLGKDAFSRFDWRVAVGDRELTKEELTELAKHVGEVVQVGDDFVYLDPTELARMAETVDKQPQPTYLEKMRAALMGNYENKGRQAEVLVSDEIRKRLKRLTEIDEISPPENLHATLRPYQARGFSWLMKNLRLGIGALIADDMGLGKTLQVIATLLQLKNDGELTKAKALVVVPTTLMTNWQREIAKFAPSLSVGIYHGTTRVLPEAVKDLPDVTLTTYGLMRRETEKLAGYKWRLLVLDEAQAVKNATSGQSVAAKSLNASQTIAMTGTPVENRLSEYWSILETVQPRLLGSLKDFTETFAAPIETDHSETAAEAFRRLTAPFMLRRLKSDKSIIADLPERNTVDQFTNLTAEQAALYSKVLEAHMKKLKKLEEKAVEDPQGTDIRTIRRGEVLKLITSMKQICNSPSQYLKTETATPDSGKAAALFDILGHCREAGRKVLIFTQYREMGERLQTWIEKTTGHRPDFLHGGVSVKTRQVMVDRFQTDRSVHAMIISLKAGGTGLNLTAASCVVHYDLWWNPAVEAQATDRAYRIGQRRDVLVYRFVTAGTFEERINEMLMEKRNLADLTVATGETWIGELSAAELQSLFTLDPKSIAA